MKRFWIVLLSLGLIIAFSTSVFAVDAKFDGEFHMKGWYNKNHSLIDQESPSGPSGVDRGSSAFYTQRLRMGMNFQVAKGLRFYTRFDALERKWMAARRTVTAGGTSPGYSTTSSEAENIAWEVAYVQFFTPIGLFTIGNVNSTAPFGTPYGDGIGFSSGVMVWTLLKGPWIWSFTYKKSQEGYTISTAYPTGTPIGAGTDNDSDVYTLAAQYRWRTGKTGISLTDIRSNKGNYPGGASIANITYKTDIPAISFYIMNKFGKIFVEEEWGMCHFGQYVQFNTPKASYLQDVEPYYAMSNYFNINIDLSPAKAGFMFIYSRGDDPNTADRKEGGFRAVLDLDRGFNPCLMLFNEEYMQWMGGGHGGAYQSGTLTGNATWTGSASNFLGNGVGTYVQNVWLYQIYGDYNISPKLNIAASYTYAYADEKPTPNGNAESATNPRFIDDEYGSEFDLTLTYKIFDNLEYMIGAAYLWTGDYFKGTDPNVKLDDNYLITHKLTLTF